MKDIEKESWKAIEEVSGLSKEQFEVEIKDEEEKKDEIKEFVKEISEWMRVAKRMPEAGKINFSPFLFILWKIMKKNG